ncbi:MAG: zinc dependent phospholipase C family protein [Polyangiaceae bacterium]|nr:zinc dependent phospholipase C family protein [Polyangiaceae bacterium]
MRRSGLVAGFALALLSSPRPASAFSTRVHLTIANDVRRALIASGSNRVALKLSPHAAELSADDAQAILEHPLEFRAGSVGPDNIAFPGMTDPSHAVGQRPFEQCEALYQEAQLPAERAYALGCFLHGATDAVAHHYVNYLSGETFTLNPLASGRATSLDNVVKHIVAESMLQHAAVALEPARFEPGELAHAVPQGFVLRTYFNEQSALYGLMGAHAKAKFDAARAASPDAALPALITGAGLAPADHLVLSPVYLREIDAERQKLRATVVASIKALQDRSTPEGNQLGVGAGGDGTLGTNDDTTACSVGCAELFARYKTFVALLAPRSDAGGNALPSAFDKLSDELRGDLFKLLPAYVQTIERVSAKLNEPVGAGSGGLGLSAADLPALFEPLDTWAGDITAIDYVSLTQAVLPDWLLELQDALQAVGVNVDVTSILQTLLDPVILPIKDAVEEYAIGQAKTFVGELVDALETQQTGVEAELAAKLAAASAPALGGTLLDHLFESGLYAHAFNAAASALAQRAAVLPAGNDPVGLGPATFDASHTPSWMQLGACDYLRDAVFPLGLGVRGALSVKQGDTTFAAVATEDSPVECHDGSLTSFASTPSSSNCALVSLDDLIASDTPRGSVSRSYPPELSALKLTCLNLTVPGLPAPPPGSGGSSGSAGAGGAGTAGSSAGGSNAGAGPDNPSDGNDDDDDGCGCRVAGAPPRSPWAPSTHAPWLGLGLGIALLRRRRRGLPTPDRHEILARSGLGRLARSGLGRLARPGLGRLARPGLGLLAPLFLLTSLTAWGCGGGGSSDDDDDVDPAGAGGVAGAGGAAGQAGTGGVGGANGTGGVGGAGGEGGQGGTVNGAQKLIAALGQSVWQGTHDRGGRQRAVELRFDADSLLWAEIDNPFGPARRRTLRTMTIEPDASAVHTTVITPSTWPVDPDNGKKEDWTLEVREGAARKLVLTRSGVTEEYDEGPWAAPTDGLTAVVRVFSPGGAADNAFCNTGTFSGPDRGVLWAFARDLENKGSEKAAATDVVAGAKLLRWSEESGANDFAITDVPGFDRFGGTELSDQFNFIVLYLGTIKHPGGSFALRERDDDILDALWAFAGDGVGSANTNDLFLEVHGHAPADFTEDEPSQNFDAQDLPIEAMLLRCSSSIEGQAVDLEANLNDTGWKLVGEHETKPLLNETLFPPAL